MSDYGARIYREGGEGTVLDHRDVVLFHEHARDTLSFSITTTHEDDTDFIDWQAPVQLVSFPPVDEPPLVLLRVMSYTRPGNSLTSPCAFFYGYRTDSSGRYSGAYIGCGTRTWPTNDWRDSGHASMDVEVSIAAIFDASTATGYGMNLYGPEGDTLFSSQENRQLRVDSDAYEDDYRRWQICGSNNQWGIIERTGSKKNPYARIGIEFPGLYSDANFITGDLYISQNSCTIWYYYEEGESEDLFDTLLNVLEDMIRDSFSSSFDVDWMFDDFVDILSDTLPGGSTDEAGNETDFSPPMRYLTDD